MTIYAVFLSVRVFAYVVMIAKYEYKHMINECDVYTKALSYVCSHQKLGENSADRLCS